MNREPHDGQGPADAILPSLSSALKVLIVGDSHALTRCGEVLNALMLAGYGFKIVGWMDTSGLDFDTADALVSERLSTRLRNGLSRVGDPDLVLLACEDPYLRRQIHDLVPLAASVLDPAALDVIARLSRATHASPPGLSDSTHIESVKEVLMSGPEMSIMVLDEDLRVLEITNYLLNKAGKPRDDCLSMPCYRILWGHDQPCDLKGDTCIAREVIGTGRSAHSLRKEIARDGSVRFFTTSGYPMKPLQDGKKRVLVVWKDVTRGVAPVLNRQADDLRENFSRLLRHDKMVALGKLASAAVHEINNPLQGILTFAKLIRQSLDKNLVSDADLERFRTYLDLIVSECSRCGNIVHGLLSFSRMSDLKKTHFDLFQLLDEVLLLLRHRMTLQGIELKHQVPDNLPLLLGDPDRIKQALLNLVVNAMEAMPLGGVITVSAHLHDTGRHMAIKIRDTGVGIPETNQSRLFEPFFTTKEEGGGVGLGLSVVYGIVSQHGGTVDVESEVGRGTTFLVTLPVSQG